MTIETLTNEDRRQLHKRYFQLWTIYKWMLITMAVIGFGFWLWVGWEALHDDSMVKVFVILTSIAAILTAFGLFSTPIYRRNSVQGLEKDLQQNQKIGKIGYIKSIERESEYADRCVFQEKDSTETEVFVLSSNFPDMYVTDREIRIEYSPHARLIFQAQLLVPFTKTELKTSKKQENTQLASVLLMVGIMVTGMGWFFDLLLVMTIIYVLCIAMVWGIVWQQRRKMRKSQNRQFK